MDIITLNTMIHMIEVILILLVGKKQAKEDSYKLELNKEYL
jgi:hypothetical protein